MSETEYAKKTDEASQPGRCAWGLRLAGILVQIPQNDGSDRISRKCTRLYNGEILGGGPISPTYLGIILGGIRAPRRALGVLCDFLQSELAFGALAAEWAWWPITFGALAAEWVWWQNKKSFHFHSRPPRRSQPFFQRTLMKNNRLSV